MYELVFLNMNVINVHGEKVMIKEYIYIYIYIYRPQPSFTKDFTISVEIHCDNTSNANLFLFGTVYFHH